MDTRIKSAAIRLGLLATASWTLGGCTHANRDFDWHPINPPSPPAYGDVPNELGKIDGDFIMKPADATKDTQQPTAPPGPPPVTPTDKNNLISPFDYVSSGYILVDRNCHNFFTDLSNARRQIDYVRSETIVGFSALSTTLALAKAAASTLAYISAGGSFVSATIDNSADYVLLTRYTDQLDSIVQSKMKDYRDKFSAQTAITKYDAVEYVSGYANLCTVDQLEIDIGDSLTQKANTLNPQANAPVVVAVEQLVQSKLSLKSLPSQEDIRTLYVALNGPPALLATSNADIVKKAQGFYWKDNTPELTADGSQILTVIATLTPSLASPPPAPPPPPTPPQTPAPPPVPPSSPPASQQPKPLPPTTTSTPSVASPSPPPASPTSGVTPQPH